MKEQALYYLARGQMSRGAYDDALDYLKQLNDLAQRTDKDTPYKVLGFLRQGMSFDALGYREYAVYRYGQVAKMRNWSRSRNLAHEYMRLPYKSPMPVVRNRQATASTRGDD